VPGDARETILVIDDNLQNREVAEGHLVSAGYNAVLADSGEVGLARFQELRPDLILLDVVMPRMDGFETCRRLRALPGGLDVPILFLTALGDLGTHKAALDSGADDFLTKPINRTELLIRLRSLLRIRRLSDELRRNLEVIRSQRDELLTVQRQRLELATLIVHDLKNPLSSILSNVEYLNASAGIPERERESLADVLRASRSMFRMVMNLLDVSRSEDGALVPRCAEFDVTALLNEVSSETVRRLEEKGQTLSLSVDPAVGAVVADRDLVRRVIENLLDNSHKYSPRNSRISIDVTTGVLDAGAGEPPLPAIELRVRDEGAGIPADYRTRVFEKYVRVEDRSVNEPRNSQGLGLVFCRTAVEAHGGRIWVEDSGARGSCFCLRLPRVTRVAERAGGPDKPDDKTPPPQRLALAFAG
jgi:two-component system sensor histidine kinase/response regulator